jgi:hypothetical protein
MVFNIGVCIEPPLVSIPQLPDFDTRIQLRPVSYSSFFPHSASNHRKPRCLELSNGRSDLTTSEPPLSFVSKTEGRHPKTETP